MIRKKISSSTLFLTATLAFPGGLVGCSLSPATPANTATVHISVPDLRSPELRSPILEAFSTSVAPPSVVSGFSCIGFNVVGPGIAPSDSGNDGDPNVIYQNLISGSSYCSYAGVTSPPIPLTGGSQTVSLVVPTGSGRLIQAVGINDPAGQMCGSSAPLGSQTNNTAGGNGPGIYEIGRTVVNLLSDTAVSMSNSYDSITPALQSARTLNCNNGSNNGPPSGCNPFEEDMSAGGPPVTGDSIGPSRSLAQQFTTNMATSITTIMLPLTVPSGSITSSLAIYTESAAAPGSLVQSTSVNSAIPVGATFTGQMVPFIFSPPVVVTATTNYWIVLSNQTPAIEWWGYSAGAAPGAAKNKNPSTWTNETTGFFFGFAIMNCTPGT